MAILNHATIQQRQGFTLVELLIAIAIIGILLAVAYPAYTNYVTKTHRTDGQIALMDLATHMERYYMENNHSYKDATPARLNVNDTSTRGFYKLDITNATDTTYTLTATPTGSQLINDKVCGTLTLNQLGEKGQTGTGTQQDCWG